MTFTKADIIKSIRSNTDFTEKQSTMLVETIIETLKRSLEDGDDILISGFGKFCVKDKRERRGRNPATGEDIMLEPRSVVTFRCSRKLRDKING